MQEASTAHRKRVAILGSGTGTNARAIIAWAHEHRERTFDVVLVVSTSSTAGICSVGHEMGVETVVLGRELQAEPFADALVTTLLEHRIDILALAGFMRFLHPKVITALRGRVLNIHPALLPKHGGVGMYGIHVHKAVLASGEAETGATVHEVNEIYDGGRILRQQCVEVMAQDTPESLAERVRRVEHELYPRVIQDYAREC